MTRALIIALAALFAAAWLAGHVAAVVTQAQVTG